MNLQLDKITIAADESHHIFNDKPLYQQRFLSVLKFHHPGFAPVLDKTGAYHIDLNGDPIYDQRYIRTFGFYNGCATVITDEDWFHILPSGARLYKELYSWCGNFQEYVCVVRNKDGCYFHIDLNGKPLYQQKYKYVGDFKDGIAVIQDGKSLHTHIYNDGSYVHNKWFYDLDIFHKGFARACDDKGWHHVDRSGLAIYQERYRMIEPFYNGFARVENNLNALLIIDESGKVIKILRGEKNERV